MNTNYDIEVAETIGVLRNLGLRLYIRGPDSHPVIEMKDKRTGRIVGGKELKQRHINYLNLKALKDR